MWLKKEVGIWNEMKWNEVVCKFWCVGIYVL